MLFTELSVIRRKEAAELSLSQHVAIEQHKTLEQIAARVFWNLLSRTSGEATSTFHLVD